MAKVVALLGLLVAAAFAGLCSEDLVLYYTFDYPGNLGADSELVENPHRSTIKGTVTSATDCPVSENCVKFAGQVPFYTLKGDEGATMPNGSSSLTAQVWFKVDPANWSDNSDPMPLISNGGNARVGWVMSIRNVNTTASPSYVQGALSVGLMLDPSTGLHLEMATTVTVVTGHWTLATFVFDRNAKWMRLYINGTQLDPTGDLVPVLNSTTFGGAGYGDLSGLASMPTFNSECPSSFGVATVVGYVDPASARKREDPCTTARGNMIGEIDDVAVWKRVLTDTEIAASVNGPACVAGDYCDDITNATQCPLSPRRCHWCGDMCMDKNDECRNCTDIDDGTQCQASLKVCTWCGGDCFDAVDSWRHCPKIESVHLPFGRVLGSTRDGTTAFYDIPFALPPVDTLRWKDPATWNRHYEQGVHDGTYSHGVVCADTMKWPANELSEDCLTLSIFVPERKRPSISTFSNAKLPVVIFLNGGLSYPRINDKGYGYDARGLSKYLNAMVVEVNYRVGIFGWLKLNNTNINGNYGAMDVIEAYHWLSNFAFRFGGNIADVTLWGVARGASVAALLVANNKITGARLILNSIAYNYPTPTTAMVMYQTLVPAGCATNTEQCMRSKSMEELHYAISNNHLDDYTYFTPICDGGNWVKPSSLHNANSILIGNSFEDARWPLQVMIDYATYLSDDDYDGLLSTAFPDEKDKILIKYAKTGGNNFDVAESLFTNIGICQTRKLILDSAVPNTFWYKSELWSHCQPGPDYNFASSYNQHPLTGSEVPFIFANKPYPGCGPWISDETQAMQGMRAGVLSFFNNSLSSQWATAGAAQNVMHLKFTNSAIDSSIATGLISTCNDLVDIFGSDLLM